MHSKNCMPWERCFGCATDGIRQERYISVNFKVLFRLFVWVVQPTPHQKPPQNSLFFVGLRSGTVSSPISASETYSLRRKQEDVRSKINHIFVGRTVLYSTACKFTLFVPCVIPAHEATSRNCVWFILIRRWRRRHSR